MRNNNNRKRTKGRNIQVIIKRYIRKKGEIIGEEKIKAKTVIHK